PGRRPRQAPLRTALLRPRPSRKPHQVVEEPPRCRSHLLPYGRGQPVSPVPARRRLLALMVDAPRHAQTFDLARHAVRHLAAAPDQTRRTRRRAENPAEDPPAVERSRPGDLRHAPRPPTAPCHLRAGAFCPQNSSAPLQPPAPPQSRPPTNPPQRQRSPMPVAADCNQNVSNFNQRYRDVLSTCIDRASSGAYF